MKFKFLLFSFFCFLLSCDSKLAYPWITVSDLDQVFKIAGDKLVLIDFETEWWTWCDRLDVDTFNDDKIKKFANDYLLSIKIDAEKGIGPEIAKRFNIRGYPTIVIANNKGYEVDRIVGYLSPDSFLKELHRIRKGKNTISSLLNKFQSNPNNFNTLFNLAKKYEGKGDIASANRMINAILAANIDSSGVAYFFSILYEAIETSFVLAVIFAPVGNSLIVSPCDIQTWEPTGTPTNKSLLSSTKDKLALPYSRVSLASTFPPKLCAKNCAP